MLSWLHIHLYELAEQSSGDRLATGLVSMIKQVEDTYLKSPVGRLHI